MKILEKSKRGEFIEKTEVMGTFVGDRRKHIEKYVRWGSKFKLQREPHNEHDPNAILILLSVKKGQHFLELGYIEKDVAARIAPQMDAGENIGATFRAYIINKKTGKFIKLYLNLIKFD